MKLYRVSNKEIIEEKYGAALQKRKGWVDLDEDEAQEMRSKAHAAQQKKITVAVQGLEKEFKQAFEREKDPTKKQALQEKFNDEAEKLASKIQESSPTQEQARALEIVQGTK